MLRAVVCRSLAAVELSGSLRAALLTKLFRRELLLLLTGALTETGLPVTPSIPWTPLLGTSTCLVSLLGAGLWFTLRSTR